MKKSEEDERSFSFKKNYFHPAASWKVGLVICTFLWLSSAGDNLGVIAVVNNVKKATDISNLYTVYRRNPMALLSGTLRTYQKAACDEEWVSIRCPAGTTISIQLAQYGKTAPAASLCRLSNPNIFPDLMDPVNANSNFTCQWPATIQYGLLQTVVGLCQKKPSCKFKTSPQLFGGDPCPGSRKFVEVAYKCRPSEFRSVIGCQDDVIQLSCNKSSRLAIYSANYGRTEYESVSCPQPTGVQEETCLASYATETVMQMCHGKRRCALGADPVTFGNPCKPESRMYLKVIHTCVPRKVLKEKYQGEPEPDEMLDDETDNNNEEGNDPTERIIEQPSIYSPSHTAGWDVKGVSSNHISTEEQSNKRKSRTSQKPILVSTHQSSSAEANEDSHQAKSSTVVGSGSHLEQEKSSNGNGSNSDIRVIYLISQGISAYDFISSKFFLFPPIYKLQFKS
ncbi:unnamed protein product [Orchesella dallaii]|uniref:SUEL-type lectin domain-containing protein n=1 Tax=Orchesella dallaii TaxID=48710 RepID=A0ABP1QTR9_9HEXA